MPGPSSPLNLLRSDGRDAVACRLVAGEARPESLYVSRGNRYHCEARICRMVDVEQGTGAVSSATSSSSGGASSRTLHRAVALSLAGASGSVSWLHIRT